MDQATNQAGATNSGTQLGDKPVVDEAAFAKGQAALEALQAQEIEAQEMGFDSHDEMVEELLEKEYLSNQNGSNNNTPEQKPEAKAPEKKPEAPAPNASAELENVKAELQSTKNMIVKATMNSEFSNFRLDQNAIPEEERYSYSRAELDKVLTGPRGALVARSAQDAAFGGNIYSAAAYELSIKESRSKIRQQGANAADALNKSTQSAQVDDTKKVIIGEPKTENERLADAIAPDDPDLL